MPKDYLNFLCNLNAPLPCREQTNGIKYETSPACDLADDFMDLNKEAFDLCEEIGKIPAIVAARKLRNIIVRQHELIGRYIDQAGIR